MSTKATQLPPPVKVSKTRMSAYARDRFMDHARTWLTEVIQKKHGWPAEMETAKAQLTKALNADFPDKDMKVLEKYGHAKFSTAFDVTTTSLSTCSRCSERSIKVTLDKAKMEPNEYKAFTAEPHPELKDTIERLDLLRHKIKNEYETRIGDYKSLATRSRYIEDVLEVWPEGKAAGDFTKTISTALVLSTDAVERIKKDMKISESAQ